MSETHLCAYCGRRPVRPAKRAAKSQRGGRTKYCAYCLPVVRREMNQMATRRIRGRERLLYVTDPITGEPIRGLEACLVNIGPDYLAKKLSGAILPVEPPDFDPALVRLSIPSMTPS